MTHIDNQELELEMNTTYEVVQSKQNLPIIKVGGYLTSSKYDPKKEASKIAEQNYKKHHVHVLLGGNGGYIAEQLCGKLSEEERLIIIEPNEKVLKASQKLDLFKNPKIEDKAEFITSTQIEEIEKFLAPIFNAFNNRIQLIISPNFEKIYPLFAKKVVSLIKEVLMLNVVDKNTWSFFAEDWQENYIKNLYFAFLSTPFNDLNKKFTLPVVIASGGPSLTKQLPLLKKYREKVILLSAGSTINTLLRNDIIPDGIVSIDGGIANYKHFEQLHHLDIPLFYTSTLHKDILKMYKGDKIFFNNKSHLDISQLTNDVIEKDIDKVIGGASVANYCLDIAYQMTTGSICLIGQDLAYTNNSTHASGNKGKKELDPELIKSRKMFTVIGYDGKEVWTDYPFVSMKKGFEDYINYVNTSDKSVNIYNCTEGGVIIEGMEHIPFEQFLSENCHIPTPHSIKALLKEINYNRSEEEWKRFYERIREEKFKNKKVINVSEEAVKILEKMDAENPIFQPSVNKKLSKLDKQLTRLLEDEFLLYLFGEVFKQVNNYYLEKENETEEETHLRIYYKSVVLYKGILDASQKAEKWYENLLSDIKKELATE
ncbi:motility associated factor glycosyltransferase family protein [Bacillus sp. FJAT-42315]|uniref:motility associated factor glycosyltransferase family protein n=1 Tax=Bacillus sp. FJAT-42315 TaxID=2014077 RepID=UPI0012FF397F|nr:6-hydroxymethylpterin diphosphokinase MptE-like protein [Bacillus sp. FJAT-42315]